MVEKKEFDKKDYSVATFAGGCFWCMEAAYEGIDGIVEVISGYSGGDVVDPTYGQVSGGKTGHKETVQVYYDPKVISYSELVKIFWRQIDPTDTEGQFSDKGSQYKTAIFYANDSEKKIADASKKSLENSGKFDKPITTEVIKFKNFYEAEEYHQDYAKKRTIQYKIYESWSRRKSYKERVWGEGEWKEKLTPVQSEITQTGGKGPA